MQEASNTTTRDLIMKIFKEAQCTPDVNDNGTLGITFHDVYINIIVNERRHSLTLFDLNWYRVKLYDIDEMLRVTREINRINSFGGIKLVLNEFNDNHVYVSSALTIPFIAEIPQMGSYFSQELKRLLSYRDMLLPENNNCNTSTK